MLMAGPFVLPDTRAFLHIFPPPRRCCHPVSSCPARWPRLDGNVLWIRLSLRRTAQLVIVRSPAPARQRRPDLWRSELRSAAAARGENCAGGVVRPEVVRALDREKVREPGGGTIDAALDSSHRAVA